jgi:uncharacterized protein YpuA (DUF1002 family)
MREDVVAAAQANFPDPQFAQVVAVLGEYGVEPHEREIARVQLAILELSGANVDKVRDLVKAAKLDYRDVLAWQQLASLSPEEGEKLQDAARALIRNWRKTP